MSSQENPEGPPLPEASQTLQFAGHFFPSMSSFSKANRPKEFVVCRRQGPAMADVAEGDEDFRSDRAAREPAASPTLVDEFDATGSEQRSPEFWEEVLRTRRDVLAEIAEEQPTGKAPTKAQNRSFRRPNSSPVAPDRIPMFVTNPDPLESNDLASESASTSPKHKSNINIGVIRKTIDDDFELSTRKNSYKATRLTGMQRKLSNRRPSVLHRRSLSSSSVPLPTNLPQLHVTPSCDENSKDLSLRLDTIFGPRAPPRSNSRPTSPVLSFSSDTFSAARSEKLSSVDDPLPTTHLSSLPNDRSDLDGLINIHVGKLDRYRRQVNSFNITLDQLHRNYDKLLESTEAQITPQLLTALETEFEETVAGRDSKRKYVDFHRGELRAIAEKRILLDEELGIPPSLGQIYDRMETQDVWDSRFS